MQHDTTDKILDYKYWKRVIIQLLPYNYQRLQYSVLTNTDGIKKFYWKTNELNARSFI